MKLPSAGILAYRRCNNMVEVLLGHPGGPYWAKKDLGAWSIPKGECGPDESLLKAAQREFLEETGFAIPQGTYTELGSAKRVDGKEITVWAVEANFDIANFSGSNTFTMEWPPKSGTYQDFPEIDRLAWVPLTEAPTKLHAGQHIFLTRLAERLGLPGVELQTQSH